MSGCLQYICNGPICTCNYWFELQISGVIVLVILGGLVVVIIIDYLRRWRRKRG